MTTQNTYSSFLAATTLFGECDENARMRLSVHAIEELATKGKTLFITGDQAPFYYLVRSGWIKLYRETLDGNQAIIDILPAGQIFGESALFEDDHYSCSAEVIEDAKLVRLSLPALKQEMTSNNTLALAMLKAMNRYRHDQSMELEHRALQNAPQRIGCLFLRLIDQHAEGPILLHLPYDKTLLASRLGMQPETFSRALSKLRSETGIVIKGAAIQIESVSQLAAFACSACSSGFPCADK